MKKLFITSLLWTGVTFAFAQSHGITYQAIIIDNNPQEIPGIDKLGNVLPNHSLTVRFTILNSTGGIDYQEDQATQTDKYGMINLTIGQGVLTAASPDVFGEISWDGTLKDLRVEISLTGSGTFVEFSEQELYFVPYAFHRNITATGTLDVDGATTLNSSLDVTNGSLTHLSGRLDVDAVTTLNDSLQVNAISLLNGQVTIASGVNGAEDQYSSYPLLVEGSNQGIAVRINGSRDNTNNFISFWDGTGMQGRVEGQTDTDVLNDPGYIFDQALFAAQTIVQAVNLVTAGVASVVDPGNLIIETANSIALAAEIVAYNVFAFQDLGVTFESGAGDYAEWLPRLHSDEQIEAGQVVGVFGGKVTKVTDGAEQILVVSRTPIILGNMIPGGFSEGECEKIAFMGQVSVWVLGPVKKGDYIIAHQSGSGFGRAISPEKLTLEVLDRIVGRAWAGSDVNNVSLINTVVGVKTYELLDVVRAHQARIITMEQEIADLKKQLADDRKALMDLVPGYKEALVVPNSQTDNQATQSRELTPAEKAKTPDHPAAPPFGTGITKDQILEAFKNVEQAMIAQGIKTESMPLLQRIKNDPKYLDEVVDGVMKAFARMGSSAVDK